MPLPPRWALGYHQCRYSYYPESRVRFIAHNFRERRIPADVIWLDIHYQDGFNPFTWDRERFPDPPRPHRRPPPKGLRTVPIVDAHPKKEPGCAPYDTGLAGRSLREEPGRQRLRGAGLAVAGGTESGTQRLPRLQQAGGAGVVGRALQPARQTGVAGIWNDMNEPAVFDTPSGTMPLDVRHDNEGQPTDHREIHNVYGLLMTRRPPTKDCCGCGRTTGRSCSPARRLPAGSATRRSGPATTSATGDTCEVRSPR